MEKQKEQNKIEEKVNKIGKKLNIKISFQDIIIILLLISYIFIFYAYKHDIEQIQNVTQQYKDIIENPQGLCYQYYEYLNQQTIKKDNGPKNLSGLFSNLIIDS